MNLRLLSATVVWACLAAAHGNTLQWFSDSLENNIDSTGQPMDTGFEFQLGVFAAGFEPSAANITTWLSHWNTADSTQYNTVQKRYAEVHIIEDNTTPFLPNAKAWVFGRRTSETGSEWILFRKGNWLWPEFDPDSIFPILFDWNAKDADIFVIGTIHSSGSPFLMKSASVRSYAQWQSAHLAGEPLNGPHDDPDLDGTPNLLEFTFGTSPTAANAPVATPVVLDENGHPIITIPRRIDHLANYLVEVSGNLVDWESGPAHTEILQNDATALVVRDLTPLSPSNPKRFIRLKVTLP